MTLASMIEANDPELGAYLNISTGYWRKKEEETNILSQRCSIQTQQKSGSK